MMKKHLMIFNFKYSNLNIKKIVNILKLLNFKAYIQIQIRIEELKLRKILWSLFL